MKKIIFLIIQFNLFIHSLCNAQFEGKRNLILDSAICFENSQVFGWNLILKEYWRYNEFLQPSLDSFRWFNLAGVNRSIDYTLYTYDANHLLLEERDIGKDQNSVVSYVTIVSCKYDSGFLKTKLYYALDLIKLDSTYLGKRDLFYTNDKVDSVLIFNEQDQIIEKWLLSYQKKLLTRIQYYIYNSNNSKWEIYRIEENLFDNNDKIIEERISEFIAPGTVIHSKIIYIFDFNNKYIRSDHFYYDSVSQVWNKDFYCSLFDAKTTGTNNIFVSTDFFDLNGKYIVWKSDSYEVGSLVFFTIDGKYLTSMNIVANVNYEWPEEFSCGIYLVRLSVKGNKYSKLLLKNY